MKKNNLDINKVYEKSSCSSVINIEMIEELETTLLSKIYDLELTLNRIRSQQVDTIVSVVDRKFHDFQKNTNSNIDLTLNNQYQGLRKDISNINTKINVFESQNDFIKNKTNIFPDIKKMIEDKFIILTDKIKSDLYDIEEKQIILITKKLKIHLQNKIQYLIKYLRVVILSSSL